MMSTRVKTLLPLFQEKLLRITIIIISLLNSNSLAMSKGYNLTIQVGHQMLLETKNLKRIAVGDPEILEISAIDNGTGILLAGKKKGSTDLLIWEGNTHSQITVEVDDAPSNADIGRKENFLDLLRSIGIKNPRVSYIDGKARVVTGEGPEESLKVAHSLLSRMDDVVPAFTKEQRRKKEIMYDLKFLEISRGSLTGLGIKWPDSIQVDGNFTKNEGSMLLIQSSFGILIKHLISNGKAKILANPVIVCEEGKDSRFLAGGEIPVVIIGAEKQDVIWKKYGIILHIVSGIEKNGLITTSLEAEVSSIDHSTGTSDIPGFITRRVKTSFSLDQGKTVVLSGLVRNEMTKDVSKLPLLGHLPVVGELFKSRNFRNNHTELIITVTPSILSAKTSDSMIGAFQKEWKRIDRQMQFRLMD